MTRYKGSETEKNLIKAFEFECKQRCKYEIYAAIAKKEGYMQLADIFKESAINELEHARVILDELELLSNCEFNLKEAINDEDFQASIVYDNYAKIAQKEGFNEIADKFKLAIIVEKEHEERFRKVLKDLLNDKVFSKSIITIWQCKKCGHVVMGLTAPMECPLCGRGKAYFEVKKDNY